MINNLNKDFYENNPELAAMNEQISENMPAWIDSNLEVYDIAAIQQGGCASGAYMPAVTYYNARETMNEYGDEILDYIQIQLGELPKPDDNISWSGLACFYLSYAVELWVNQFDIDHIEY